MTAKPQNITQELLARAHSPDSAARIYADKIERRPLFLHPKSPEPANPRSARRQAREKAKARRKQKPRPLSARERRRRGLYDVPRTGQKYAIFEPLHRLWLGYIREVLDADLYAAAAPSIAAAKLSSADFHGAEVTVARSGCVSRVGLQGIVIKDSRFAFEIITRKNQIKIVPKEGTMFRVEVPPPEEPTEGTQRSNEKVDDIAEPRRAFVFEVLGDQFLQRAADRANKKFKTHFLKKL